MVSTVSRPKARSTRLKSPMFHAWQEQAARLERGEITKNEYDQWRYNYPALDTSGQWHKVSPSKELSDYLVEAFKDRLKPDK